MSKDSTQTTRLLAAAAFGNSGGVRDWLLSWFEDPSRAVPAELEVDLELVAAVATYSEQQRLLRRRRYVLLGAISLLSLALGGVLGTLGVTGCWLVSGLSWIVEDHRRRQDLRDFFGEASFDPEAVAQKFSARLSRDAQRALPEPGHNLTVHGGFDPFVGSGQGLGGWSLAVPIKPCSDSCREKSPSIDVRDLYSDISEAMGHLEMPGLKSRDQYFVHGSEARRVGPWVPDPYGRPRQEVLAAHVGEPSVEDGNHMRRYRWFTVSDYGGDIVLSCFLRFALRGPTLLVEVEPRLLAPLRQSVREVDHLAPSPVWENFFALVLAMPFYGFGKQIGALCQVVLDTYSRIMKGHLERKRRKMIDARPRYNYGATYSLRSTFASSQYSRFFQRSDSSFFVKTINQCILDALIEHLEERGIDISKLQESQTTILNQGLMIQGGSVNAANLAIGSGALASKGKLADVIKGVTRPMRDKG